MQIFFSTLPKMSLLAHEGHGHAVEGQGSTMWHYLTEPQHAWVFAALIIVAVAVVLFRKLSSDLVESEASQ